MNSLEIKSQADYMCYDSNNERIYISSNAQKILDTSGNQLERTLHYGKHLSMRLSPDGRSLAFFSTERELTIIDPSIPDLILYSSIIGKKNSVHFEYNMYFKDNELIIFSVQHVLYALYIHPIISLQPIYIGDADNEIDADWKKTGHLSSVSCDNRIIAALHYSFNPSTTKLVMISNNDMNNPIVRELPKEIGNSYTSICVLSNSGIAFFSRYHNKPMLFYSDFDSDFSKPDFIIDLPPVYAPVFSQDGRYLSFSVVDKEHPYSDCYLINAHNWAVEEIVQNNMVYNPSFSNDGKLWLVPGKKSYVYRL